MEDQAASRDFVGYGEVPPDFLWPGDARVAVSLVINVEEGAERSVAHGDAVDDLGAHWVPAGSSGGIRNLTLESAFEYGSRAGIWRLLRILERHQVPATAFCCAAALEANPALGPALVRFGHEIADHGYKWDCHLGLAAVQERRLITTSREAIRVNTGQEPTTWYSRDGLNPWTRQTLAEEGFAYDSNSFNDDLPHWGTGPGNPRLPVLPYSGDTNDSGLLGHFPTAAAFAGHLIGSLDMLLSEARSGPSVLSVGLHPRLIGRPAYALAVDRFLSYALEQDTWVATRRDIVAAWLSATGGSAS